MILRRCRNASKEYIGTVPLALCLRHRDDEEIKKADCLDIFVHCVKSARSTSSPKERPPPTPEFLEFVPAQEFYMTIIDLLFQPKTSQCSLRRHSQQ